MLAEYMPLEDDDVAGHGARIAFKEEGPSRGIRGRVMRAGVSVNSQTKRRDQTNERSPAPIQIFDSRSSFRSQKGTNHDATPDGVGPRFLSRCVFLLLDGPVIAAAVSDSPWDGALQLDSSGRWHAAVQSDCGLCHRDGHGGLHQRSQPGCHLERRRDGLLWWKLRNN